jgi:hypothetical protein
LKEIDARLRLVAVEKMKNVFIVLLLLLGRGRAGGLSRYRAGAAIFFARLREGELKDWR